MENQPMSFKSSLNGFNKDDVINYIEQLNIQYRKMETAYKEQIERKDAVDVSGYEKIIADLKVENESLKKQLQDKEANPYREKAESYDKMSSQLGSMIIMANEKAAEIIDDANQKVDNAKQDIRVQIESLSNQLYNEFIIAVKSYSVEFNDFNQYINEKINDITQKFAQKNNDLKQNLMTEVNNLTLFSGDDEKI